MTNNDKGVALVIVFLIVILLEIIAVIVLNEAAYNMANAGANETSEYSFCASNSGINSVLPVIAGETSTPASWNPLTINNISNSVPGIYYYTTSSDKLMSSPAYQNLDAYNFLSSSLTGKILPGSRPELQIGFEYTINKRPGVYQNGLLGILGIGNIYYYTGTVYVISRYGSNGKILETGANFSYPESPGSVGFQIPLIDFNIEPSTSGAQVTSFFQISR